MTATVAKLQPTFMTTFAGNWATVWDSEIKGTEVTATKAGKDDDSWYGKLGR